MPGKPQGSKQSKRNGLKRTGYRRASGTFSLGASSHPGDAHHTRELLGLPLHPGVSPQGEDGVRTQPQTRGYSSTTCRGRTCYFQLKSSGLTSSASKGFLIKPPSQGGFWNYQTKTSVHNAAEEKWGLPGLRGRCLYEMWSHLPQFWHYGSLGLSSVQFSCSVMSNT